MHVEPRLAERTSERQAWLLEKGMAVGWIALTAQTWRVWTPQNELPQVPLVEGFQGLPQAGEWVAWLMLWVGMAATLTARKKGAARTAGWIAWGAAVVVLVGCDQLRLQAWVYHGALVCAAITLLPVDDAGRKLRLLTASIYLFSGWSKLDVVFLDGLGRQFAQVLLGFVGMDPASWPNPWPRVAAGSLPAVEIVVGLLLCLPARCTRLRRVGAAGSLAMHAGLLLVLGPWGMQHSGGVLLWNVLFLFQNLMLFGAWSARGWETGSDPRAAGVEHNSFRNVAWWKLKGQAAVGWTLTAAMCLPLAEPWGWCDTWAAWAVYAPRMERVEVRLSADDFELLPPIGQWTAAADSDPEWVVVRFDRWCLAEFNAPAYPEPRYHLGLALGLSNRLRPSRPLQVRLFGPADRWTGRREVVELTGPAEIRRAAQRYWLNVEPR